MEVPRQGVKKELWLPAYTTASATPGSSCICDIHDSLRQHQILNLLIEAWERTCVLMEASWIRYRGAIMRTPAHYFFKYHYEPLDLNIYVVSSTAVIILIQAQTFPSLPSGSLSNWLLCPPEMILAVFASLWLPCFPV